MSPRAFGCTVGINCDAVRAKSHNCRQDVQAAVCSRSALLLRSGVRTALPLCPLSAIRRKISFRRKEGNTLVF
jgi:hypothetical protein